MAKKEFSFRGYAIEQLQQMDLPSFAKLCRSDRRRRILREMDKKLMKDVEEAHNVKKTGKEPETIRTHLRDTVITPKMVGLKFAIHRGNEFSIMQVDERMLGHYLGEFSLTRKKLSHGKAGIGATKSSTAITAR